MKERIKYVVQMTEDDVKNIRTAFTFVKNAFITHLRHTSDHDSVMSVMGTLGLMVDEIEHQYCEHIKENQEMTVEALLKAAEGIQKESDPDWVTGANNNSHDN